jgi:hypothetical protein
MILETLLKKDRRVSEDDLRRTYQNDLRAIGRLADDNLYKLLGVYEVSDGFIVRGFTDSDPEAIEALELPSNDIRELIVKNFSSSGHDPSRIKRPLCPTGYEDFMRAIGYELEQCQAKAVAIQEMLTCFCVTFRQLRLTPEGYTWEPQEWLLTSDKVREMLDAAFLRRNKKS